MQDWENIYEPHKGTLYVSQSTHEDDLAKSIMVAFNNKPPRGIDVTFMGEVALLQTYRGCLIAQAVIESQNPGVKVCWQLSRRKVASRANKGETHVADFFSIKITPKDKNQ